MPTGNVFTGARARLLLQGVQVGYARNVTVTETVEYEAIDVLDNIETTEHAPTAYRVSWQAGTVRIVNTTFKSQGWFPETGGDPAEHLTNILNSGELTLAVEDSRESKIVKVVEGARVSEMTTTIDARGVVGEDVTGVGIRVRDEADLT